MPKAFVLIFAISCSYLYAQNIPSELIAYPSLVLYNGKIITADENFSIAEAVAVRDGRLLAVGKSSDIRKMIGPDTKAIDLQGKSVVPGFIDTHLHQPFVGNDSKGGRGGRVKFDTVEAGLEEVKKIVAGAPPGEWLFLDGPNNKNLTTLTRQQLDTVSPDHPVAIGLSGGEYAANSLALQRANFPPNLPGVVKDPKTGEPTGQLREWATGVLGYDIQPWPEMEPMIPEQKKELEKYAAQGITTIAGRAQGLSVTLFRELWRKGELPIRVRFAHEFLRQNPYGEAYLKRLGNLAGFGDSMLKIMGATTQHPDGTSNSGAALTWQPKLRQRPHDPYGPEGQNRWEGFAPDQTDRHNIVLAARYGWNINGIHSQGDKASSLILQAYAEADKDKPIAGRFFGIDHGLFQTEENIALMKQLGVIPSIAAKYLFRSPEDLIYIYGADRLHTLSPVKKLIASGLKPVAESDIETYPYSSPLWNLEKFVTRKDEKGRVWNADEKIGRKEALYMYTRWAAAYVGDPEELGSIEKGRLGDLVVLGGDLMTVPEDDISELPIEMTIVGGKVVYDRHQTPRR